MTDNRTSEYAYCPIHGDLLAANRSYRCGNAPTGHEYATRTNVLQRLLSDGATEEDFKKAVAERDAATAATERVRAIHVRGTSSIGVDWCLDDHHKWPCPTIAALDEAPKPAEPEWEAEKQYRAIIGRPWNILDRKAPKDVPIFEATGPKNERVVHLQRSEETHAWVERWEERDVRLGPWLPVEGESKP